MQTLNTKLLLWKRLKSQFSIEHYIKQKLDTVCLSFHSFKSWTCLHRHRGEFPWSRSQWARDVKWLWHAVIDTLYLCVSVTLTSADAGHAGRLTAPPSRAGWRLLAWRRMRRWWTGRRTRPRSWRRGRGASPWTRVPLRALCKQSSQQGLQWISSSKQYYST